MKIKIKVSFHKRLSRQIEYIAQDSPVRAKKFKNDILSQIKKIYPMPYKHRKSIYFEDDDIRDLIFKGYTIVYRINKEENVIEVFGFVKYQKKPVD
ncbi:MAG: type II toxin-antitoxin system RelE/ParE family toxin [Bacteroidales bacterium]|nr:type II toxin-antitoxin system RelE/ParE family toxin [Bacteroidales bacterium]